ncbi:hypothetical protein SAMN02983003_1651 [Devosia enhydra]|uniref:Uncharacterized protein n=1 Tax=Devosia enhydra TaxID=665118 RepID=A0A1K2HWK0_9HYPH|nr:hypothetical protein [Devosia enhydra]SFZ83451.1 hypothetical protein SAMN02983003_1651 [Devosia enhydra]
MIQGLLEEEKGATQIQDLKAERAVLIAEREAIDDVVPDLTIHPAIADAYLEALGSLEGALKGPEGPYETEEFKAVRDLVESIVVTPDPTSSSPHVEVNGDLARFLAPSQFSSGG